MVDRELSCSAILPPVLHCGLGGASMWLGAFREKICWLYMACNLLLGHAWMTV